MLFILQVDAIYTVGGRQDKPVIIIHNNNQKDTGTWQR